MPGPIVSAGELPWWLDPAKKSVTDPLYITLARRAASAAGLDNPEAAVMGAASPLGLAGEVPVETMMHPSKEGSIKGGQAVWELLRHLQNFASKEPEVGNVMPGSTTGRYIPPPGRINAPEGFLLPTKNKFEKDVMGKATSITRAPELTARRNLLLEQMARTKPQENIPTVSSMEELKDLVGKQGPSLPPPPLSQKPRSGAASATNRPTKLNEDLVRLVRKMYADGMKQSEIAKKLNINASNLSGVIQGGAWAWVK